MNIEMTSASSKPLPYLGVLSVVFSILLNKGLGWNLSLEEIEAITTVCLIIASGGIINKFITSVRDAVIGRRESSEQVK